MKIDFLSSAEKEDYWKGCKRLFHHTWVDVHCIYMLFLSLDSMWSLSSIHFSFTLIWAIDFWYIFLALTKESLTRIKETQNLYIHKFTHSAQIMTLTSLSVTFVRNSGRRRDPVSAKYLNYWTIAQVTVAAFYSLYPLLTDSTEPQSLWTLQALNKRHGLFPSCFMFLPRFILR